MGVNEFEQIPDQSLVTIDTAPVIYLLEDNPDFLKKFLPLFERIENGALTGVISVVTLSEILSGPLRNGNEILADHYYRALTASQNWRVKEMDAELSFIAARIRSKYNLKLPDAIQVATAIQSQSFALITHDRDFKSLQEIKILGI